MPYPIIMVCLLSFLLSCSTTDPITRQDAGSESVDASTAMDATISMKDSDTSPDAWWLNVRPCDDDAEGCHDGG